jgi:hypothetical protein
MQGGSRAFWASPLCEILSVSSIIGFECAPESAIQAFQLRQAAQQGKLGLCVPDLPAPVPIGDNIGDPL